MDADPRNHLSDEDEMWGRLDVPDDVLESFVTCADNALPDPAPQPATEADFLSVMNSCVKTDGYRCFVFRFFSEIYSCLQV